MHSSKVLHVHTFWNCCFSYHLLFLLTSPIFSAYVIFQSLWVGYLNEILLRPRFRKSLDPQISSLVGYFKKTNAFLAYFIRFNETVHDKWCSYKSVRQIENGLERGFVKL